MTLRGSSESLPSKRKMSLIRSTALDLFFCPPSSLSFSPSFVFPARLKSSTLFCVPCFVRLYFLYPSLFRFSLVSCGVCLNERVMLMAMMRSDEKRSCVINTCTYIFIGDAAAAAAVDDDEIWETRRRLIQLASPPPSSRQPPPFPPSPLSPPPFLHPCPPPPSIVKRTMVSRGKGSIRVVHHSLLDPLHPALAFSTLLLTTRPSGLPSDLYSIVLAIDPLHLLLGSVLNPHQSSADDRCPLLQFRFPEFKMSTLPVDASGNANLRSNKPSASCSPMTLLLRHPLLLPSRRR